MRLLLAEDRPRVAMLLERSLRREGHSVLLACDGEEALSLGKSEDLDCIILEVMLPRVDGFTVIKTLRAAHRTTPTIIITARGATADIVQGLDSGADDYLTKPFALDVLFARIRALSRRGPAVYPADLEFEDLKLSPRTRELQRGDRKVSLTRTEFALLEILMRRAGSIVPREVLTEAGWGLGAEVNDSNLYVFIRSLRARIAGPGEPQLLQTARGVGYTLRPAARRL